MHKDVPSLSSLPAVPFVNSRGRIFPNVAEGSGAHVFAVYDQFQNLQFIGFSKDLRNSLRTLLVRVPLYTFTFKHVDLPDIDQQLMMEIRQKWLDENNGDIPPGLAPAGADIWSKPIDCGNEMAATQRWRAVLEDLSGRGIEEELTYNEELIKDGLVDVAHTHLSDEERSAMEDAMEQQAGRLHEATVVVENTPVTFQLSVQEYMRSKGGVILKCELVTPDSETTHTIVLANSDLEQYGATEEQLVERCFALLLHFSVNRDTKEKQITTGTFPASYFTISNLEQWYGDLAVHTLGGRHDVSFEDVKLNGELALRGEMATHWDWKRVDKYGPAAEASEPALGADGL